MKEKTRDKIYAVLWKITAICFNPLFMLYLLSYLFSVNFFSKGEWYEIANATLGILFCLFMSAVSIGIFSIWNEFRE